MGCKFQKFPLTLSLPVPPEGSADTGEGQSLDSRAEGTEGFQGESVLCF